MVEANEELKAALERIKAAWHNRDWTLRSGTAGWFLVGTSDDDEANGYGPVVILLTNRGRIKPFKLEENEYV
jgi:hypothetical protein